jgi:hypothetical protein
MKIETIGLERLARAMGGKHKQQHDKHHKKHHQGNAIADGDFGAPGSTFITIRGD